MTSCHIFSYFLDFQGFLTLEDSAVSANVAFYYRCQSADVMVGDLVLLETGARVPADGLYLKGSELRICITLTYADVC